MCDLRPRVLVLTAPVDPTADMVVAHLYADGVPFLRLDSAQFPTNATLTGEIGRHGRWCAELNGVSLEDVRAIYYRRPGRFVFDMSIPLEMVAWREGKHDSASGAYWNHCRQRGLTHPTACTAPDTNPGNSPTLPRPASPCHQPWSPTIRKP